MGETTPEGALGTALYIHIPGEPHAQGRARHSPIMTKNGPVLGRGGRPIVVAYDPKESRNWKAFAGSRMLTERVLQGVDAPLDGPLHLEITALFTMPTSRHLKKGIRPRTWKTGRPDEDNVTKAVKDAASGVLWLDDKQVVVATCLKITAAQGEAPGLYLTIRKLTDADIPPGLPLGF